MSVSLSCPRQATHTGEVAVFRNPLRRSTFLADIAVRDEDGRLAWEPLALNDPRAIAAIARCRKASPGGARDRSGGLAHQVATDEGTDMHNLQTKEGRRAALEQADISLRIEDLERDEASKPVFEAWVNGEITEEESIKRLIALG